MPRLIPAVAYVRKSTKGKRRGQDKQEKSIAQQRAEVLALAEGKYRIVRWYEDEGVSGWKREADRPGFAQMLADARSRRDFRAIICDDADRFTRASWRKAVRDIDDLAEAGVEVIVSVKEGTFRIKDEHDAGEAHRLIAIAMANHEFSRKLSRRVTLARRNAAKEGRRTGGPAPYGTANDGKGGLVPGNPAEIELVRWIFRQFADDLRSINWITGDLNRRKVPSPRKAKGWTVRAVGEILRRSTYRGDFSFNRVHRGQFFGIDNDGEVKERNELNGRGKVYRRAGVYEPLVDPELFDRAQRRLDLLTKNRGRRKRVGYPLSGVLVCGHCGAKLHGFRRQRRKGRTVRAYRCPSYAVMGQGYCSQFEVREQTILPVLVRVLREELDDLSTVYANPPAELKDPEKHRESQLRQLTAERDSLRKQIERAERNLLLVDDDRTAKSLSSQISDMRDKLEAIQADMVATPEGGKTAADWKALAEWWREFENKALTIRTGHTFDHPDDPDTTMEVTVLADPLKVNAALLDLQVEVRLFWERETEGRTRARHVLARGQLCIGEQGKPRSIF